jgi:alpha-D-ribose 1-methylphosphonate 5-triphosphate synthase subunit PhnH
MPASQPSIQPGFSDPVFQAQSVFRAAMEAMARPGRPVAMSAGLVSPRPLNGPMAALLLTLCDFETSIWLDAALADAKGVRDFLRFHTGARIVDAPLEATFAVISDARHSPPIADFAQGTAEYPDRSTTLILGVRTFASAGWKLEGPGIEGQTHFSADPVPDGFVEQVRGNRVHLPRGVDIIFATEHAIAALPRSVILTEAG